ncbi:MAG: L28 family ribosomal protein [bacterium]
MGRTCDLCDKGVKTVNYVSHAQNKVKRTQKTNLQSATIKNSQGKPVKIKNVCSTCRRTLNKQK